MCVPLPVDVLVHKFTRLDMCICSIEVMPGAVDNSVSALLKIVICEKMYMKMFSFNSHS